MRKAMTTAVILLMTVTMSAQTTEVHLRYGPRESSSREPLTMTEGTRPVQVNVTPCCSPDEVGTPLPDQRKNILKGYIYNMNPACVVRFDTLRTDWNAILEEVDRLDIPSEQKTFIRLVAEDNLTEQQKVSVLRYDGSLDMLSEGPFNASRRMELQMTVESYTPDTTAAVAGATTNRRMKKDRKGQKVALAFRTNLLFPLMNIGMEIPLGDVVSIEGDLLCPWAGKSEDNMYTLRAAIVSCGLRFHFGRNGHGKCLTGHSLGLSPMAGQYDLCYEGKGVQGYGYGASLDYTYCLPVSRDRLRMEFTVGGGYVRRFDREYRVYEPYQPKTVEPTALVSEVTYWGPTKAAVTLVVPIFRRRAEQ